MKPPTYPKPAPKNAIQGIRNKQERLNALLIEKKRKVQLLEKLISELDVLEGKIIQVTESITKSISTLRKGRQLH
jgi:hypothetical protein